MRRKAGKKSVFWTAVMILCYLIAAACIAVLLYILAERKIEANALRAAVADPVVAAQAAGEELPRRNVFRWKSDEEETPAEETAPATEAIPVPVDFDYLHGINTDVYAWLSMGWSGKEYPVLQHKGDDSYYLRRDLYGNYSPSGSLFTESVRNAADMNDPCTVIFGHNMSSHIMFGGLENNVAVMDLDDPDNEAAYLTVYTPGGMRRYRIVCGGTFSNESLLFTYDFSAEEDFLEFFEKLEAYPEGGYRVSSTRPPVFGDQLLILSTCHRLHSEHRYLTIAVLTEHEGL